MFRTIILIAFISLISLACSGPGGGRDTKAMQQAPFGTPQDVAYARQLWNKLEQGGFNTTAATLYVGGPPHGPVREVLEGSIDGRRVIVKRNYGGKGITPAQVSRNRSAYLKAITVMAKREPGYDPQDRDWFWVKYKPDGSLHKNPKGMLLAGRVAKGMAAGCIACHKSASGNDMVFTHNKAANADITIVK